MTSARNRIVMCLLSAALGAALTGGLMYSPRPAPGPSRVSGTPAASPVVGALAASAASTPAAASFGASAVSAANSALRPSWPLASRKLPPELVPPPSLLPGALLETPESSRVESPSFSPCVLAAAVSRVEIPAEGGTLRMVETKASDGCLRAASSDEPWLDVNLADARNQANGSAMPNTTGKDRRGTVYVTTASGSHSVLVVQRAMPAASEVSQ